MMLIPMPLLLPCPASPQCIVAQEEKDRVKVEGNVVLICCDRC